MIWESAPWKREIVRVASALHQRKSQKRWNEASSAKLEKEIFYSAFAVRKLLEAKKISDEMETRSIKAFRFPPTDRPADIMNWHRLNELYDLTRPSPCQLSLKNFCNQFIHSFVFQAVLNEEERGLAGLFVSSDHKKAENLYYFDIDQIIDFLDAVADDDILTLKMERKGIGQRMEVLVKSSKMDDEVPEVLASCRSGARERNAESSGEPDS